MHDGIDCDDGGNNNRDGGGSENCTEGDDGKSKDSDAEGASGGFDAKGDRMHEGYALQTII